MFAFIAVSTRARFRFYEFFRSAIQTQFKNKYRATMNLKCYYKCGHFSSRIKSTTVLCMAHGLQVPYFCIKHLHKLCQQWLKEQKASRKKQMTTLQVGYLPLK